MTPAVSVIATGDPLFRAADQVPLGRNLGLVTPTDAIPSRPGVRPFGLGFATAAAPTVTVDLSALCYDVQLQLSVDAAGSPAFAKH